MNVEFKVENINKWTKAVFILAILLFGSIQNVLAQNYQGTVSHNAMYSFDFTISCSDPTTAVVTMWYTTAEPPDVVPQLHLGGGVFVNMSGPSPYTYTITGLTSCDFSFYFYIAWAAGGLYQDFTPNTPANTPLPNDLFLLFELQGNYDGSVNLSWVTEDANCDYFNIERSIDLLNWNFVDRVDADGNSSISNVFTYTDSVPSYSAQGLTYYRLKMIDRDGGIEYSDIRAHRKTDFSRDMLVLFPNPTAGSVNIDFSQVDWSSGDVYLRIYNLRGELVHSKTFSRNSEVQIDLPELATSMYNFLFVQGERIIYQAKVIRDN